MKTLEMWRRLPSEDRRDLLWDMGIVVWCSFMASFAALGIASLVA